MQENIYPSIKGFLTIGYHEQNVMWNAYLGFYPISGEYSTAPRCKHIICGWYYQMLLCVAKLRARTWWYDFEDALTVTGMEDI